MTWCRGFETGSKSINLQGWISPFPEMACGFLKWAVFCSQQKKNNKKNKKNENMRWGISILCELWTYIFPSWDEVVWYWVPSIICVNFCTTTTTIIYSICYCAVCFMFIQNMLPHLPCIFQQFILCYCLVTSLLRCSLWKSVYISRQLKNTGNATVHFCWSHIGCAQ